jgi:hypothetical protein
MKKIIYAFIAMLVLSGCEHAVVESREVVTYKIVDVKRPKHFRVSLQDNNGRIFKNLSVSKHCNRWREVQVGSMINLTTDVMKLGDERWIDIHARSICPGN